MGGSACQHFQSYSLHGVEVILRKVDKYQSWLSFLHAYEEMRCTQRDYMTPETSGELWSCNAIISKLHELHSGRKNWCSPFLLARCASFLYWELLNWLEWNRVKEERNVIEKPLFGDQSEQSTGLKNNLRRQQSTFSYTALVQEWQCIRWY